jgi:hypothetical protein
VELEGGRQAYAIQSGPCGSCIASWRRKVLLAQGRYEFQAQAKTEDVSPMQGQDDNAADEKGTGAGLRISGANRTEGLHGTNDWKSMKFEFEIVEPVREVELVAEIRAMQGKVWFDKATLRVKQLPAK